ncbi:CEP164 [Symbiodinium sp. CCMP2592]|nr:CEP164 [Symbiodinium sp. CCMP2592]
MSHLLFKEAVRLPGPRSVGLRAFFGTIPLQKAFQEIESRMISSLSTAARPNGALQSTPVELLRAYEAGQRSEARDSDSPCEESPLELLSFQGFPVAVLSGGGGGSGQRLAETASTCMTERDLFGARSSSCFGTTATTGQSSLVEAVEVDLEAGGEPLQVEAVEVDLEAGLPGPSQVEAVEVDVEAGGEPLQDPTGLSDAETEEEEPGEAQSGLPPGLTLTAPPEEFMLPPLASPASSTAPDSQPVWMTRGLPEGPSPLLLEALELARLPYTPELIEYSRHLGMDPIADSDLLWIAVEALKAPLPFDWTVHFDASGKAFYYHAATGATSWTHPMEYLFRHTYRNMLKEAGRL